MQALLSTYLRLLAGDSALPLPTIADVVLFAGEEKETLRFAVPRPTGAALGSWAGAHGLAVATRAVVTRPMAYGWNAVEPLVDPEAAAADPTLEVAEVVIIARDRAVADELCACEVSGDSTRAGALLGYPACCVAAYGEHSQRPGSWIAAALARTDGKAPRCWCNRLPLAWRAPTFVGEIYPCSFTCEALTAHGRRVHELMRAAGLGALAQRTLDESLRPVCFRPERDHPPGSAVVPVGGDDPRLPDFIELAS